MIKCAHCKGHHPTVAVVRICSELHTRPVQTVERPRPVPTFQPPAPPAPRPALRVETRNTNVRCEACNNGVIYLTGHFENGQWKGSTGKCYRCNGKGWQTPADQKRNYWYDAKFRRA